jgi:GT2 family glycosyltransferase
MQAADGEYLVILNNDTYVTGGWLFDLVRHLRRDEKLGLVGPVTNSIGNEAQIEITYADMVEMQGKALEYTSKHAGKLMQVNNLAFFCVAMRRTVWQDIGPLDEAFTVGFFEDDDYCRRIMGAGFTLAIAEDVFVHHQHSASFNTLTPERKNEIFERNKRVYEQKWGQWVPHVYRRGR